MDIVRIVGIGIIALFLSLVIKQYRPEFTIYISIIAGIIIAFLVIDKLTSILSVLQNLADRSGVNYEYIIILFKITGIAYLTEFGINICNDSGETAIASKIELGGKIIMIYLSIPIILKLVETITNII